MPTWSLFDFGNLNFSENAKVNAVPLYLVLFNIFLYYVLTFSFYFVTIGFLLRVTWQPCPGYFDVSLAFLPNPTYPVFLRFRFPPDSWKAATQTLLVKMMSWSNLIMVTDCFPLLFMYLFCFSLRFRFCVGWAASQFVFENWCSVPLGRVLWHFHPRFPPPVAAWQCLWHRSRFACF